MLHSSLQFNLAYAERKVGIKFQKEVKQAQSRRLKQSEQSAHLASCLLLVPTLSWEPPRNHLFYSFDEIVDVNSDHIRSVIRLR